MPNGRVIAESTTGGWVAWLANDPCLKVRGECTDLAVCRLLDRVPRSGMSFDELMPDWSHCRDGHVEWISAARESRSASVA